MDSYVFKYQRIGRHFLEKIKDCVGHRYDQGQDKMVVYFKDGSLREIVRWKDCGIYLGTDWVLFTKKNMEKESGQPVKLTVNAEK